MFSIVAPVLAGAMLYKRLPGVLKTMFWLVFTTFVLEACTYTLYYIGWNNQPFFHLYTYAEFTFITLLYIRLIDSPLLKRVFYYLLAVFVVFSLCVLFIWEDQWGFNSLQRYAEGLLVFIFISAYFVQLMKRAELIYLERHPYFVLSVGYLMYFAGTLFLFLASRELMKYAPSGYWALHGIFNIWLNLIYTLVLWKGTRNWKESF